MTAKSTRNNSVPPRGLPAIRFLALAAMAVSAYLVWASFSSSGVAGCGPESGCDQVLQSRWAHWLGLPVSLFALLVYAIIILATFQLGGKVPVSRQRQAWSVLMFSAVAVLSAVVWFVVLQVAVIKAICPFCMTAHGLGALAAVIILFSAPIRQAEGKPWQQEKQVLVLPSQAWKLAGGGILGTVLLVIGQLVYQPQSFETKEVLSGATLGTETPLNRPISLFGGAIALEMNDVPLLGVPEAPQMFVSLFDYSCHHCRIMHGHLLELHRVFSNRLAIVNLPMPLSPACNYTVKRMHPDHVHACDYARTGLAVWRANREKMEAFDRFMFNGEKPPSPEAAKQHATELVGTNALERALQDPWVDQMLMTSVSIYATNYQNQMQGSMPQLIIGSNLISGTLRGPQDLYPVLSNQLGLVLP